MRLREKSKSKSWGIRLSSRDEESDCNMLTLSGFGYVWFYDIDTELIKPCYDKETWGDRYKLFPDRKTYTFEFTRLGDEINWINIGKDCFNCNDQNKSIIKWDIPWLNTRYVSTEQLNLENEHRYILFRDIKNNDNTVLCFFKSLEKNKFMTGSDYPSNFIDKFFNWFYDKFGEPTYHYRIDVYFNVETGEETDTWKGGTISSSFYVGTNLKKVYPMELLTKEINKDFEIYTAFKSIEDVPEQYLKKTTVNKEYFTKKSMKGDKKK